MADLPASRRVYDIVELRQRILRELPNADLASFMRVERGGMEAVAGELYRTMGYVEVRSYVRNPTPSQKLYLSVVQHITAEDSTFPIPYSRALFRKHVLGIKSRCQALRRMDFEEIWHRLEGEKSERWTVHFDPTAHNEPPRGRIVINRILMPEEVPTDPIETSIPAPTGFTIDLRLDLEIMGRWDDYGHDLPLMESWLKAFRLRRWPSLAVVLQSIDFDALPITLGDIIILLLQQIKAGRSDLLTYIGGEAIPPFTIGAFHNFAFLASSSLTSLVLSAKKLRGIEMGEPYISFAELPSLTTIIRDFLVNLHQLTLTMDGAETAEAVCGAMLDEYTLDGGGTISDLSIYTTEFVHPHYLFNSLRVLSRLCTAMAEISILPHRWAGTVWNEPAVADQHTAYLQYLRGQNQTRKKHLSTVDFPSLGITKLADIDGLKYDADDKPLPLRSASESSESG